jgi:hypothetical protein
MSACPGSLVNWRSANQSAARSMCSAMPGMQNKGTYDMRKCCSTPAWAIAAGWPVDIATKRSMRWGAIAASCQPMMPPQSWPTRWTFSIFKASSRPRTSARSFSSV